MTSTRSGACSLPGLCLGLLLTATTSVAQTPDATGSVVELDSGTDALLQAVSAVDTRTVWVSGHDGVVLRTTDAGETWTRLAVQTLDSLQFRDVHGFDDTRAVILSAGTGPQSRIYRTTDGGSSWTLAWMNEEPDGFYDCLDFWDDERGIAYGDAVDGELRVLLTHDGGASWSYVEPDRLPPAVGSEGGFAASGTCVDATGDGRAWIGTGAGERPRLLATDDYGSSWSATDLPLVAGDVAGAFTVVIAGPELAPALGGDVVLGGDLEQADGYTDNVAFSTDGGATWSLGRRPEFAGAVYGAALAVGADGPVLIAAGPAGLAATPDVTRGWSKLDSRSFWAVGAAANVSWAVGPEGRVVRHTW